jgi:hypothetical protein
MEESLKAYKNQARVQARKSVSLGRLVRLTLKKDCLRYIHPLSAGLD